VFGNRAANAILEDRALDRKADNIKSQPWLAMGNDVSSILRTNMTKHCGVRRNAQGLNSLLDTIEGLIERVGPANPLIAARMIAGAALAREESRGGHFRDDYPNATKTAHSAYFTYDMLD